MNRRAASKALASIPLMLAAGMLGATSAVAQAQGDRYPRLTAAVTALEDAQDFLEKAPDDFGGHKAAAIAACRAAVRQLRMAMHYRSRRGK